METNVEDIKHIRSMMERSSKFLSLSGMSGVFAGIIALMGAALAHFVICGQLDITGVVLYDLTIIASVVLVCAISVGLYFSIRKANKSKSKFWLPVTWQLLQDLSIPLVVGGLFCFIFIYHNILEMVAPAMLIFYGLALIYAGARTYRDIKMLGVCEIILGLLAGIFVYNGLIFWSLGFGVLHVVYGIVMYIKYDLRSDKNG